MHRDEGARSRRGSRDRRRGRARAAAAFGQQQHARGREAERPGSGAAQGAGQRRVPAGVGGQGDRHDRRAQRQRGEQSRRARRAASAASGLAGGRGRRRARPDSRADPQPAATTAEQRRTRHGRGGSPTPAAGCVERRARAAAVSRAWTPASKPGAPGDVARWSSRSCRRTTPRPGLRESPGDAQGQQQRREDERPGSEVELGALGQQPQPAGQRDRAADAEPAGRVEGRRRRRGRAPGRRGRRPTTATAAATRARPAAGDAARRRLRPRGAGVRAGRPRHPLLASRAPDRRRTRRGETETTAPPGAQGSRRRSDRSDGSVRPEPSRTGSAPRALARRAGPARLPVRRPRRSRAGGGGGLYCPGCCCGGGSAGRTAAAAAGAGPSAAPGAAGTAGPDPLAELLAGARCLLVGPLGGTGQTAGQRRPVAQLGQQRQDSEQQDRRRHDDPSSATIEKSHRPASVSDPGEQREQATPRR